MELGTGCGAVAVSLALEREMRIVATDVSLAALTLAAENAAQLGARLGLVQADLLRGFTGPLHVVLANLPYVPSGRVLPKTWSDTSRRWRSSAASAAPS